MQHDVQRQPKVRTLVASATLAAVIATATMSGVASASTGATDDAPPGGHATRAAEVCDHLDEIEARMASHLEQIVGRQTRLATRRVEAATAGRDRVVERIDRAAARLAERATQVQERTDRLTDWAADHCDAG